MAENELRKHLRTALDAQSVGLNTEELTRFVKHLEKHGVTVGAAPKAKAKAKPRKKAASKKEKPEPKPKPEPKAEAKPAPKQESKWDSLRAAAQSQASQSYTSFKPKEKN